MTRPRRKTEARSAGNGTELAHTGAHGCGFDPYSWSMDATGKWNDARLDEFAKRTDENFREVRTEIRDEVGGLRKEMNQRFAGIEQRFNILFGALATGFVAAVVQHFLG
jgi:hypothetical protein